MSRKFRVGNDISINWSLVNEDSSPYIVEGKNFAIELLIGNAKHIRIGGATASGNTISFKYWGKDQGPLGSVNLIYIENNGKVNMVTFDTEDAFTMVPHSWLAVDEDETPETITFDIVTIVSEKIVIGPIDAVKYTPQTLTEEQQEQARTNIAAASKDEIPTVPTISTDIKADGESDSKTASPKAVKTFVEGKGYYVKPANGIPADDLKEGVIPTVPTISTDIEADEASDTKTASPKAVKTFVEGKGYYTKPQTGIPKTDLASAVQTSLGKADTAIQNVKTINGQSVVGTGDLTVSGVAPDLVPTVSDVEFIKKDTGVNATMAKVKEIKGKSLVWNQLVNPQTSGSETKQGITCVRSNGLFTMNGTREGTGNASFLILPTGGELKFISGHKYLLKGCYPGGSDTTYRIWLQSSTAFPAGNRLDDTGAGIIKTALADETLGQGYFFIQMQGSSTFTFTNAVFAPQIFDLTKLFGSDNEPSTVEEFESLYSLDYYAYNAGDIVNNKVQSIITRDSEGIQIDKVNINVTSITGKASESNGSEIIFPNGMKSAGTAYDSLVIDNDGWCRKAIKRIGVVDMGTMSYELVTNTQGVKYFQSPSLNNVIAVAYARNKYCTPFLVWGGSLHYPNATTYDSTISTASNGKTICIVPEKEYESGIDYKTAMAGVLLYYELATPEEYTIDAPIFLGAYKIDPNGTEERTPIDTESAVTAPFSGSIQYGLTTSEALNVNKKGLQKDLIAGQALSLQGTEVTQVEDISTVAKSTGIAKINEVMGKSFVWNELVVNGNFSLGNDGLDGWHLYPPSSSGSVVSVSVTNGVARLQASIPAETSAQFSLNQTVNVIPIIGHKYHVRFTIRKGENSYSSITWRFGTSNYSAYIPDDGYYINTIITAVNEQRFWIWAYNAASETPVTYDWYYEKVSIIDLTLLFGSGNEPSTVAEFESWLANNIGYRDYYAYNPGEIISNNTEALEITGLNQLNLEGRTKEQPSNLIPSSDFSFLTEEYVLKGFANNGYVNSSNIAEYSLSANRLYVKTSTAGSSASYGLGIPVKVQRNTTYCIRFTKQLSSSTVGVVGFNERGEVLSSLGTNLQSGATFNTGDAVMIAIDFKPAAINTAATWTDICLSVSGSRNGQYEPYQKSELELNLATITGKLNGEGESVIIFPDGMRSAGTAFDSLIVDEDGWCRKAVRRMEIANMGDFTWLISNPGTDHERAQSASIVGKIKASENTTIGNLLSVKYTRDSANATYAHTHDMTVSVNSSKDVFVYDSSLIGHTAEEIKTAMAGVPLIYELATPLEYVLDTPIYMGIKTQQGGVIRQLPENGSAPTTAPMRMDISYALPPEALISGSSLENLLEALKSANKISDYTMTYNATSGKWEFTIS